MSATSDKSTLTGTAWAVGRFGFIWAVFRKEAASGRPSGEHESRGAVFAKAGDLVLFQHAEGLGRVVWPPRVGRVEDVAQCVAREAIGARMSEAVELEWRDVDLGGARAILWHTKNGQRRIVDLPPRIVEALARIDPKQGIMFRRWPDGKPYADHERRYGGQIKTAWRGAIRRAGLDPGLRPHDLRHTWATWRYALHPDPTRLRHDGGWSSLTPVERYAHLMPAGCEATIREFYGTTLTPAAAVSRNVEAVTRITY
jgi:hypothetical protein